MAGCGGRFGTESVLAWPVPELSDVLPISGRHIRRGRGARRRVYADRLNGVHSRHPSEPGRARTYRYRLQSGGRRSPRRHDMTPRLHDLTSVQAERRPDKVAVVLGSETLTYGAL